MSELLPIDGQVRRYDWGGDDFIATLLGEPAGGGPVAEYWLGAHPDSPSAVQTPDGPVPLDVLVDEDPPRWLGRRHAMAFGHWPHLLKVLDVARPLSIQVHPDREQARSGYAREEALGIPRKAPQRNFHDPNPKPELAVALSPFWLLFGLAPDAVLIPHLEACPSLAELAALAREQSGAAVFRRVLEADETTLAAWLVPVFEMARSSGVTDRREPAFWIDRWLGAAPPAERVDRGVFGFLLMNILELAPGEGIFQGAGVPHAYLEGQLIELMTSSDNVLRCGLTSKHVDPAAVLAHAILEASPAHRVDATPRSGQPGRMDYPCPVDDFLLSRWTLAPGQWVPVRQSSASILLVLDGTVRLVADDQVLERSRGEAALSAGTTLLKLEATTAVDIFMASVPEQP